MVGGTYRRKEFEAPGAVKEKSSRSREVTNERCGPKGDGGQVSRKEMTKSVAVPFVSHDLSITSIVVFPMLYFSFFKGYCEKAVTISFRIQQANRQ